MNVLVTGGAGYIGSHTCVELLEKGFGVVAGVMGRQDGLVAEFPAQLPEPAVPKFPGGHLDADAFRGCDSLRVKGLHMARDSVAIRPRPDERLVGVTVRTAQVEVAVCNGKRPAFPANLFCQNHRVPATADGDKDHGF